MLARTGSYDHCNLTVLEDCPREPLARFRDLLFSMSYDDPEIRPLLDLEGLKQWMPPREEGYRTLKAALDHQRGW